MKKFLIFSWFVTLLITTQTFASVTSVFEKNYYDSYREGKCGLNVLNFFERLESTGEDVRSLSLVYIVNKGSTVFGMVNAEKARTKLHGKLTTEEKNWYHHQFAIDRNGTVYDFDYLNYPRPLSLNKYVEDMYLNENECLTPKAAEFCAGRNNKLRDYYVNLTEAREVLEGNGRAYWSGSLQQLLDKNK